MFSLKCLIATIPHSNGTFLRVNKNNTRRKELEGGLSVIVTPNMGSIRTDLGTACGTVIEEIDLPHAGHAREVLLSQAVSLPPVKSTQRAP